MSVQEQKTQLDKKEVLHDLNNLNYLLRALARLIESVPSISNEIKRLSFGAINTTDKLIAKVRGSSTSIEKEQKPSEHDKIKDEDL